MKGLLTHSLRLSKSVRKYPKEVPIMQLSWIGRLAVDIAPIGAREGSIPGIENLICLKAKYGFPELGKRTVCLCKLSSNVID